MDNKEQAIEKIKEVLRLDVSIADEPHAIEDNGLPHGYMREEDVEVLSKEIMGVIEQAGYRQPSTAGEDCPMCKGMGVFHYTYPEQGEEKCIKCKGTGKIPKPSTANREAVAIKYYNLIESRLHYRHHYSWDSLEEKEKQTFRDDAEVLSLIEPKVLSEITDKMHENNWESLIYFHPGKEHRDWTNRWVAGTLTGKDNDLICVEKCSTRENGEKYLSPAGNTVLEAINNAIELRQAISQATIKGDGVE